MDTKVISDAPGADGVVTPAATPQTPSSQTPSSQTPSSQTPCNETPRSQVPRAETVEERSLRRFAFDPASAPNMMAAFAWNTAGIRR